MTHVAESSHGLLAVALVGYGEITEHQHVCSLHAVRREGLVVFAEPDEERRRRLADRFGIVQHLTRDSRETRRHVAEIIGVVTPASANSSLAGEAVEKTVRVRLASAMPEAGR